MRLTTFLGENRNLLEVLEMNQRRIEGAKRSDRVSVAATVSTQEIELETRLGSLFMRERSHSSPKVPYYRICCSISHQVWKRGKRMRRVSFCPNLQMRKRRKCSLPVFALHSSASISGRPEINNSSSRSVKICIKSFGTIS